MQTRDVIHRLVLRVHELERDRKPYVAADVRLAITTLKQLDRELQPRGGSKHVRDQQLRRALTAQRNEEDAI